MSNITEHNGVCHTLKFLDVTTGFGLQCNGCICNLAKFLRALIKLSSLPL
jgi:bacterioferritin-associated ferredoxin